MSEESVQLDPVVTVARITALEMLARQMMVIQLRILNELGQIELSPDYIRELGQVYSEKVDESKIIETESADVNYAFKANVLSHLERFFDEIADHVARNP